MSSIVLPEGVTAVKGGTANPNSLRPLWFNPEARTEFNKLRKLRVAIQRQGNNILNPLHIYGGERPGETHPHSGVILDGNRRRSVALELGITCVDVTVYYGPFEVVKQIFVDLNDSVDKLNKQQQMEQQYYGGPAFPDVADAYEEIRDLLTNGGDDSVDFESFISGKNAPFILSLSKSVLKFCNLKRDQAKYKPQLKETLLWMMESGQQQQTKAFMRQFSVARGTKTDFHIRKILCAVKERKALEW